MDTRQLAYLDAMGIDVWQPRREPKAGEFSEARERLIGLGPGDADILCLGRTQEESLMKLAADISKAMLNPPLWGWPVKGGNDGEQPVTIENAIADKLLTSVLVFGEDLADVVFGRDIPDFIGTARLHVVPGLDRLARDQEAKRTLWKLMLEQGIAASGATRTRKGSGAG